MSIHVVHVKSCHSLEFSGNSLKRGVGGRVGSNKSSLACGDSFAVWPNFPKFMKIIGSPSALHTIRIQICTCGQNLSNLEFFYEGFTNRCLAVS
jgi:hypothetical protein